MGDRHPRAGRPRCDDRFPTRAPSRSIRTFRRATACCRRAPRSASMPLFRKHSARISRAHHLCVCRPRQDRRLCRRQEGRGGRGRRRDGGRGAWRGILQVIGRSRSTSPTSRRNSPNTISAPSPAPSATCMRRRSSGRTRADGSACAAGIRGEAAGEVDSVSA